MIVSHAPPEAEERGRRLPHHRLGVLPARRSHHVDQLAGATHRGAQLHGPGTACPTATRGDHRRRGLSTVPPVVRPSRGRADMRTRPTTPRCRSCSALEGRLRRQQMPTNRIADAGSERGPGTLLTHPRRMWAQWSVYRRGVTQGKAPRFLKPEELACMEDFEPGLACTADLWPAYLEILRDRVIDERPRALQQRTHTCVGAGQLLIEPPANSVPGAALARGSARRSMMCGGCTGRSLTNRRSPGQRLWALGRRTDRDPVHPADASPTTRAPFDGGPADAGLDLLHRVQEYARHRAHSTWRSRSARPA